MSLVQEFVDAINEHRKANVVPSEIICVDESISRWYGLGGHWIDLGLPHYVAIDRKPENGCEIQDAACGRSGIMLRLELVVTAEEEAQKEFEDAEQHGTAVARRLVSGVGSGCAVCADSYFASVSTAESLLNMGLNFIGVVKNSTGKFPMNGFQTGTVRKWTKGVSSSKGIPWKCHDDGCFMDRQKQAVLYCNNINFVGGGALQKNALVAAR